MLERAREVLAGEDAWVVGGAVRDELLGRPMVDLDIACADPEQAARRYARGTEGAPFPLSERHGAWRVALPEQRTVDFTPLPRGIQADLASRDFTINAIARPLAGGDPLDPFGGLADLEGRVLRAVGPAVFQDDPLRLLRAVRLEDELDFRLDTDTETLVHANAGLVTRPAGERILGELVRLSAAGFERLEQVGLLATLGGSLEKLRSLEDTTPELRLVAVFGDGLGRLPVSNDLRRYARALLRAELPSETFTEGNPSFSARDRALGDRCRAVRRRRASAPRGHRGGALDRAEGAPPARRRARPRTRPGNRPVARPNRGGTRGRDDLDARRRARARPWRSSAAGLAGG